MLVEFKTVRCSYQESHERTIQETIHGISSLSWNNEKDYMTVVVLEMDNAIDYSTGKIAVNDEMYECVYVNFEEEVSAPLLIEHDMFKMLFEKVTGKEIFNVYNIIGNESYTESIKSQ